MKIALQLYTVRDAITDQQSLFAALEKIQAMGYQGVEFAGYYGAEPEALAAKLAQLGLTVVGSHEVIDNLEKDLDGILDYAVRLGNTTIAMAWSPANSPAELARTLSVLKTAREKAAAKGIRILYHNHDHEFKLVEGVRPIDEILAVCPLEADCYWVFFAGEKPGDYLRTHRERIGLIHLKDGGSEKASPCAIGEGENDIRDIARAAEEIDHQWLIVENDNPQPDGFGDVARSIQWLRQQGIAR